MAKQKQVTIKMTLEQAAAVLLALVDAQKGYGEGPTTPERIVGIREVISNLDKSMEEATSNSAE